MSTRNSTLLRHLLAGMMATSPNGVFLTAAVGDPRTRHQAMDAGTTPPMIEESPTPPSSSAGFFQPTMMVRTEFKQMTIRKVVCLPRFAMDLLGGIWLRTGIVKVDERSTTVVSETTEPLRLAKVLRPVETSSHAYRGICPGCGAPVEITVRSTVIYTIR